jgi:hypothetical protein
MYVHTYLCDDFHLLALAVLGFRDGCLEALDKLVIEFLVRKKSAGGDLVSVLRNWRRRSRSYRSARNSQFNLPPVRTHERLEVVTDALQYPQSIVLRQSVQEILYCSALVRAAGVLFQLSHNLRLVAVG